MAEQPDESTTNLQNHGLRMRRATSWATHASECLEQDEVDGAFLFYYIAFNALYSDIEILKEHKSERQCQVMFFEKLEQLDKQDGSLYNFVWQEYSNTIGHILANPFIYEPYWQELSEAQSEDEKVNRVHVENWRKSFKNRSKRAFESIRSGGMSSKLLVETFARLSLLRNQLAHGSATFKGSVNRQQVKTGAWFLHKAVPLFIQIVDKHAEVDWGIPPYPPQES